MSWFYWFLVFLNLLGAFRNLQYAAGKRSRAMTSGVAASAACINIALVFGLLIMGGLI